MGSIVASNSWGEIIHHDADRTLELRWLPSNVTDGAFKATLALFAWQAEKLRPSFLLIDATEFRHEFGPGVMQWRDDSIIPRYGAAGARKFAFHVPAGFPNTIEAGGKEMFEGPAIFPTAWFSERQHALTWFRQG
ncbi:MAG: hypothetical protein FWD08_08030 [Alphaproteobacteria bacterium]|nr:hypothetical protein [Alphaproteobacteria bacterium]